MQVYGTTVAKTNGGLSPYAYQMSKNPALEPKPTLESAAPAITPPKPTVAPTTTPIATPTKTAAQPAAAPATSGGATPNASEVAAGGLYDYTTDPVLQQAQAAATQAKSDADTQALAAQKALAIQYGDPTLVPTDANTVSGASAANDPYGIFNALAAQEPIDQNNLDETLNQHNLYYSGARINQQGQLATQYQQQRADDTTQEQQAEGQITQNQLAAYLSANQSVEQANTDAYNTYFQEMLAALSNPSASTSTLTGATDQTGADPGSFSTDPADYITHGDNTTVTAPAYGPDAGYQPVAASPAVYRSGGGTVTVQTNKGKLGKKLLQ